MELIENYVVYDCETLSNFFSVEFKDFTTGKKKIFYIHESRNDLKPMIRFVKQLKDLNYFFVGYNNIRFDGQIFEFIRVNYKTLKDLSGEEIASYIYSVSQKIISYTEEEAWSNLIPEWNLSLPQLDIYKQCHFDSINKRTSLKWLQFTMRFPNIETMPINHDSFVHEEDIPDILYYQGNDVGSTHEFFKRIKFETELRLKLSQEYNRNLLNASEPRMAREIFGKFLSESMGIPYRELKEKRTFRRRLQGEDLVFNYINFKDPLLNGIKDFFLKLEFDPYNFETNNLGLKEVKKTFRLYNIPDADVGLGGIHACVAPGVYECSKNWNIHDIDAKSFYPNIGIKNKLFPEHLSEVFCMVYEDLYNLRTKIPKEDPKNYIFKIILNSAYGLSKEPNNYFHDPKYTFAITINGQLLLLKLAELLKNSVPNIVFYQLNTDGVTIGYDPIYLDKVKEVMKKWEKVTKIELEDNFYKKMVIVDVNNYLAVDKKDKVKRKGLFGYSMNPEDKEMAYHKNPSALIIPKALEAYFIKGIPYKDFIMNCTDIFDFCKGVKLKKDFDLLKFSYNKEQNKIDKETIKHTVLRYYVSTEPTVLKKKYKKGTKKAGQTVELEAGWNMTYYNIHKEMPINKYNLNYSYYIAKTKDVIDQINPNATQVKITFIDSK